MNLEAQVLGHASAVQCPRVLTGRWMDSTDAAHFPHHIRAVGQDRQALIGIINTFKFFLFSSFPCYVFSCQFRVQTKHVVKYEISKCSFNVPLADY